MQRIRNREVLKFQQKIKIINGGICLWEEKIEEKDQRLLSTYVFMDDCQEKVIQLPIVNYISAFQNQKIQQKRNAITKDAYINKNYKSKGEMKIWKQISY